MQDEIITEVYRIRDQLSAKYNHNLDNLIKAMAGREQRNSSRIKRKSQSGKRRGTPMI